MSVSFEINAYIPFRMLANFLIISFRPFIIIGRYGQAVILYRKDELIKRKNLLFYVIPAKAGIQSFQLFLDSRFHGSDDFETFYEFINDDRFVKSTIFTTKVAKEE